MLSLRSDETQILLCHIEHCGTDRLFVVSSFSSLFVFPFFSQTIHPCPLSLFIPDMLQQIYIKNAREGAFSPDQNSEGWPDYEDHPHHRSEYGLAGKESLYFDQEQQQEDGKEQGHYNDLGPEIYGDFHVAPKRRPKPAERSTTTRRPLKTPALACHEATMLADPLPTFVPPEIIRVVCSFASQKTLCRVLMLVCREWYYLAKPFVKRTGEWRCATQDAEDSLLEKLRARQINELRLFYDTGVKHTTTGREEPFNKEDSAWTRFFSAITTPVYLARNDSTLKGLEAVADIMETMVLEDTAVPKQCLLSSVQQIFVSSLTLWLPRLMPALLPYFGEIHTLALSQTQFTGSIPLFTILNHCHALQDLSIKGNTICSPSSLTVCCSGNIPTPRHRRHKHVLGRHRPVAVVPTQDVLGYRDGLGIWCLEAPDSILSTDASLHGHRHRDLDFSRAYHSQGIPGRDLPSFCSALPTGCFALPKYIQDLSLGITTSLSYHRRC